MVPGDRVTSGCATTSRSRVPTPRGYSLANVSLTDDGAAFRLRVTNAYGTVTSGAAILHVVENRAPTITFTAPAIGATYAGGQKIYYAASCNRPGGRRVRLRRPSNGTSSSTTMITSTRS